MGIVGRGRAPYVAGAERRRRMKGVERDGKGQGK